MASNLDFLNKNLFRKYPFQASSSLVSNSGLDLPLDLVAAISITTTVERSNLYISQVVLNKGFISITVEHYDPNTPSNTIAIGCFSGKVTQDFQSFSLTTFVPFVGGFLTVGSVSNISTYFGLYSFTFDNATLEPTTVFCHTPPAVTSLTNKTKKAQGNLTFGNLVNLTKTISTYPNNFFQFEVVDTTDIESLTDFSSAFNNCPTPVITSINSTVPYPINGDAANNNNIYLFGVSPITFDATLLTTSPDAYGLVITTPGLDLPTLCSNSPLLPPITPNFIIDRAADSFTGISRYYTKSQTPVENFLENKLPEYTMWPNFIYSYVQTVAVTGNGTIVLDPTNPPILTPTQSARIREVAVQTSTGETLTSTFNILNDVVTTSVIPAFDVTDEGVVVLAVNNGTFVPTSKFSMDLSSVSGDLTLYVTVFYNLIAY